MGGVSQLTSSPGPSPRPPAVIAIVVVVIVTVVKVIEVVPIVVTRALEPHAGRPRSRPPPAATPCPVCVTPATVQSAVLAVELRTPVRAAEAPVGGLLTRADAALVLEAKVGHAGHEGQRAFAHLALVEAAVPTPRQRGVLAPVEETRRDGAAGPHANAAAVAEDFVSRTVVAQPVRDAVAAAVESALVVGAVVAPVAPLGAVVEVAAVFVAAPHVPAAEPSPLVVASVLDAVVCVACRAWSEDVSSGRIWQSRKTTDGIASRSDTRRAGPPSLLACTWPLRPTPYT